MLFIAFQFSEPLLEVPNPVLHPAIGKHHRSGSLPGEPPPVQRRFGDVE